MVEEFGLPRATLVIVFESDNLSAKSEEYRRAEDEALEPLRNMEDIRSVTTYADTKDQRFLSEDGSKTTPLSGSTSPWPKRRAWWTRCAGRCAPTN